MIGTDIGALVMPARSTGFADIRLRRRWPFACRFGTTPRFCEKRKPVAASTDCWTSRGALLSERQRRSTPRTETLDVHDGSQRSFD